jgi:hypothetical protein
MARRSKTKYPKDKKRTRMKKSKKGGENTSERTRATKTMQKYRRGALGKRKASSRRLAQEINKGLDTLDPLLKEKILAMSGRGKRKKKSKRKKNRKVKRVKKVTKGG